MKTGKRALIAIATLAVLVPLGAITTQAATTTTNVGVTADNATAIDWAIDIAVRQRVIADKLAPANGVVLREQMQLMFRSLPAAEQARLITLGQGNAPEMGAARIIDALNESVVARARTIVGEVNAASARQPNSTSGPQAKLGPAGPDLVFVATVGPCRVLDTRFIPLPLNAFTARQVWVSSDPPPGYPWSLDQGGTGTAGSGNCAGTVFDYVNNIPVSVVASVTVTDTSAGGALQAWNGGTTLSGGAVVNWPGPGDRTTNTTVIPMNRFITAYAGSGLKRDIGLNNNSGAAINVIIDVLGYFIQNQATALECITLNASAVAIAANGVAAANSPACTAGYTHVATTCFPSLYPIMQTGISGQTCYMNNTSASAGTFVPASRCCRVPGN